MNEHNTNMLIYVECKKYFSLIAKEHNCYRLKNNKAHYLFIPDTQINDDEKNTYELVDNTIFYNDLKIFCYGEKIIHIDIINNSKISPFKKLNASLIYEFFKLDLKDMKDEHFKHLYENLLNNFLLKDIINSACEKNPSFIYKALTYQQKWDKSTQNSFYFPISDLISNFSYIFPKEEKNILKNSLLSFFKNYSANTQSQIVFFDIELWHKVKILFNNKDDCDLFLPFFTVLPQKQKHNKFFEEVELEYIVTVNLEKVVGSSEYFYETKEVGELLDVFINHLSQTPPKEIERFRLVEESEQTYKIAVKLHPGFSFDEKKINTLISNCIADHDNVDTYNKLFKDGAYWDSYTKKVLLDLQLTNNIEHTKKKFKL